MHNRYHKVLLLFLLLLVTGCSDDGKKVRRQNLRGEFLVRNHDEYFFTPPPPQPRTRATYPWEETYVGGFPRITKEFFRCKGNPLNPVVVQERGGKEPFYFRDCPGGRRHGLPLKEGREFVYPCLIDLLNYIQEKTERRVVVTTGHRCPIHNAYCDQTPYNWGSKHMLGAEVDFYVEGMEEEPEKIINLLMAYYKNEEPFLRYNREGLNISTPPWYNKEIFIKLYLSHEGRDFDNQHPYPYIGIQVRYDRDEKARVVFTQEQAQNYLRH
ncbi:MAG: hypothetical protein JJU12_01385 [Chlamydiales bacterium]|nr:hypothetical protein [Chlamydiales bacterium]